DRDGIVSILGSDRRWFAISPFLDLAAYCASGRERRSPPRLDTVAMMRHGDKLVSYRVLGEALLPLLDRAWSLEVIGTGPARAEFEQALAPLGDRVTYADALPEHAIVARLQRSDIFVWPAINEAYGMALLQAQACGLPVVAGGAGGVAGIVAHDR